jgi:hypothetical protein
MKVNSYSYETVSGFVTGWFNIYQARNGKIYLMMGSMVTPITESQINELCIDVFSLHDFDYDDYKNAYGKEASHE